MTENDIIILPSVIKEVGFADNDGYVVGWTFDGSRRDPRYPHGYTLKDLVEIYNFNKSMVIHRLLLDEVKLEPKKVSGCAFLTNSFTL